MMLSLRLGRTLAELGATMSSEEFALWVELYRDNQWGEKYEYERCGIVASMIGNYAGMMRAKDAPALKPSDFMPYAPKEEEQETEPDPVAYFTAIAKKG